jgi:hypothetical protein
MQALKNNEKDLAGLPVFITDDTTVMDTTRLCQRLTKHPEADAPLCGPSWWSIPLVLTMFLAMLLETICSLTGVKIHAPPVGLMSYLGSFIYFSRLRASLHMKYEPLYNEQQATDLSLKYYTRLYKILEIEDSKE